MSAIETETENWWDGWEAGRKEATDGMLRAQAQSIRNIAQYVEDHPEVDRAAIIASLRQTADMLPELVVAMTDAVAKVAEKMAGPQDAPTAPYLAGRDDGPLR